MNAQIPRFRFSAAIVLAIALLLFLSMHQSAHAAGHTYIVNSTLDQPDADASNGVCFSTPSGKCTLRAAIMEADYASGPNTIILPSGVYTLTRPGYDNNALVGDLDIAHDLTIQGAGSGTTIVDGNGAVTKDRVFQILSSATEITMTGITIRNGQSLSSTVGVIGGGGLYMEDAGHLLLNNVIIESNTAQNGGGLYTNFSSAGGSIEMDNVVVRANIVVAGGVGAGGGMYAHLPSSLSQVIIQDSQVYSNTADGTGGGFYVDGNSSAQWVIQRSQLYSNTAASGGAIGNFVPLTLSDSRLHDNHVTFDGGAIEAYSPFTISLTTLDANSASRFGGAIFDLQTSGSGLYKNFAYIVESTLSSNYAQNGGGIYHDGFLHPESLLTLLNSTVSGNTTSKGGGGTYVYGGQLQLLNATIASNHVLLGGGPGGGLYITATATFTAQNSVIANNWHNGTIFTGPIPDDCLSSGTVGTLAYNLILTTTRCFVTGPQGGNIVGQDPLLSPLQNNGGSTQTRALLLGSPAIDTGAPAGCTDEFGNPLTIDQRGFARPFNSRCDMGAYEWNNKTDQRITFSPIPDRTLSESPFTVNATASSGLIVTYTSSGVCTVSGNSVTLTALGNCTITAHQAGDTNYNAASDVSQSFTVLTVHLYLPLILK
jgi:CSLREA domain-containing protein